MTDVPPTTLPAPIADAVAVATENVVEPPSATLPPPDNGEDVFNVTDEFASIPFATSPLVPVLITVPVDAGNVCVPDPPDASVVLPIVTVFAAPATAPIPNAENCGVLDVPIDWTVPTVTVPPSDSVPPVTVV